jgi:hypothetical protein
MMLCELVHRTLEQISSDRTRSRDTGKSVAFNTNFGAQVLYRINLYKTSLLNIAVGDAKYLNLLFKLLSNYCAPVSQPVCIGWGMPYQLFPITTSSTAWIVMAGDL